MERFFGEGEGGEKRGKRGSSTISPSRIYRIPRSDRPVFQAKDLKYNSDMRKKVDLQPHFE